MCGRSPESECAIVHLQILLFRQGVAGGVPAMFIANNRDLGGWTPIRPTNRNHPNYQIQ
jgi:hypothetical protein